MDRSAGNEWTSSWVRGGRVLEMAWIGKDVLAWCLGAHIVFFNLSKRTETLRWCWTRETGEGASCVSGHPTRNIYAFAENDVAEPRILIYAYPSMMKIAECAAQGVGTSYLATAFAGHERLVSLSSYPEFALTVWSWKTGTRLASTQSWINDAGSCGQRLRVHPQAQFVAQLGLVSGQTCIWEMSSTHEGTRPRIKSQEIILPRGALAQGMEWCPTESSEPVLAIADNDGHVYLSNPDGSRLKRIILSQHCGLCLEAVAPDVCWFRGGIVLKTTFCQIRYYKKVGDIWQRAWYIKTHLKPCLLLASRWLSEDRLFFHTREGHLMHVSFAGSSADKPRAESHAFFGARHNWIDFVYPWCHHLITSDNARDIFLLNSYTGAETERLELFTGHLTCLTSHSRLPLICVTSKEGEFALLNFLNPERPQILCKFRLQTSKLDLVNFSQCGRFVTAVDRRGGRCYCVNLFRPGTIRVVAVLESDKEIADVILRSEKSHLKLLVLFVSPGDQLVVYQSSAGSNRFTKSSAAIELGDTLHRLHLMPRDPGRLLGMPVLSRHIKIWNLKTTNEIEFERAVPSDHRVRLAFTFADENWLTSSAPDGLAIIRSIPSMEMTTVLMPHRGRELGTVKTIANPSGTVIACLGRDGSIAAMKRVTQVERTESVSDDYKSLDASIVEMLSNDFERFSDSDNLTWFEWMERQTLEEESQIYAETKSRMRHSVSILREKIVALLDKNDVCPKVERLPVSDFDLDKVLREKRIKTAAREQRNNFCRNLEAKCEMMDAVASRLKDTFWEPQVVIGRSIFAISEKRQVTNYPLSRKTPRVPDHPRCAHYFQHFDEAAIISPSGFYTQEELGREMEKQVRLGQMIEEAKINEPPGVEDEGSPQPNTGKVDDLGALEGTTTGRFIEHPVALYSQFHLYSFAQQFLDSKMVVNNCEKLVLYFNNLFDDVYAIKERALSLVKEKAERLEVIESELKSMFRDAVSNVRPVMRREFSDSKEKPEGVIKVEDGEMTVKAPYTPEKGLAESSSGEEETPRAFDEYFQERALTSMMEGVLEMSWEAVIRRGVPVPEFVLTKHRDQYTEDEVEAANEYEIDVANLNPKRERYKQVLESEYAEVASAYEESVKKFDDRHAEFHGVKLKVEAAILQLNLRSARGKVRHLRRLEFWREDNAANERIALERRKMNAFVKQTHALREIDEKLNEQRETLDDKRKAMTKEFKSRLSSSLNKRAFETLWALYKKQPRLKFAKLSCASSHVSEVEKSIATGRKLPYLLPECLDYLKALEGLDSRPQDLPSSIDANIWANFVALRRLKIRLDLKMQAHEFRARELGQAIKYYDESMAKCRYKLQSEIEQRERMKDTREEFDLDCEVQLVLKIGQVETTRCSGYREDTANSIFVPRRELESLNRAIRSAGGQKLRAINRMVNFNRGTFLAEWQHRCLKAQIEDLRKNILCVRNFSISKDIEAKQKAPDPKFIEDLQSRFDQQRNKASRCSEKRLMQWLKKLKNLELKVKKTKSEVETLDAEILIDTNESWWEEDLVGESGRGFERKVNVMQHWCKLVKKMQGNRQEMKYLTKEYQLLHQLRRDGVFFCRPR